MPKKIKPPPPRFGPPDRVLQAFKLASPLAMAMRTDDFAHCVEASLVGASALRRFGLDAKAVPCSIVGANRSLDPPVQLSLGLTRRDIYPRLAWADGQKLSFEDWSQTVTEGTLPDDDVAMHMAILVLAGEKRWIADPTIGQLNRIHSINVHLAEILSCFPRQRWPAFETTDGWDLSYDDSPHARAIQRHAIGYNVPPGWVQDLVALMDVAISCNLDANLFISELETQSPEALRMASERLMSLMQGRLPRHDASR